MTKREMILNALFERLKTLDVVVKRNEIAPQKIPATGLVIMRDGKQGVPEILLSPPICLFNHEAEVEVIVQAVKSEEREINSWMNSSKKLVSCYHQMKR